MRNFSPRTILVFAVICFSLVAIPAAASASATISGKVYWSPPFFGLPVPVPDADVTVYTAFNGQKGAKVVTLKTDANGDYSASVYGGAGFDYKVDVEPWQAPVKFGFVNPIGGERDVHVVDGQVINNAHFSVRGSRISGVVFNDLNQDGAKQAGEPGVAGADVTLSGPATVHLVTAADGSYVTGDPVLPSGTYTATASRAGYNATTGAVPAKPMPGLDAAAADFGLHYETGTVTGAVYAETNGMPGRQAGEPPIAGANVTVTGSYDNQNFSLPATSQADGNFSLPVFAGSNRVVSVAQPTAYADGPEYTAVPGAVTGADSFSNVSVAANATTGTFEFGETGATISGVTFSDRDQDGVRDAGEPGVGGRKVAVSAAGFTDIVTSSQDGSFVTQGAPAGDITFTPDATADAVAPDPMVVHPSLGQTLTDNDLGYRFASLTGTVVNRDGGQPAGDVTVTLSGAASASTASAADGNWGFYELAPGAYAVHATAPAGFDLASSSPGNIGGAGQPGAVTGIGAGIGQLGTGYELGIAPAPPAPGGAARSDTPDAPAGTPGVADAAAAGPAAAKATKVKIIARKRNSVRKSRLKLGCELNGGEVRTCSFVLRSAQGKVLARGKATAKARATKLTVTLKLTKLGKRLLKAKRLAGKAAVTATQAGGPKLIARKKVALARVR